MAIFFSSLLQLTVVTLLLPISQVPLVNGQSSVLKSIQDTFGNLRKGNDINNSLGTIINTLSTRSASQYKGSGVGPLNLFRSSATNAEIVNVALKGLPVPHSLGLAFGDEFPMVRDDFIVQMKSGSGLRALTKIRNWRLDRDNKKNEINDPYVGIGRQLITGLAMTFLPSADNNNADKGSDSSSFRVNADDQ